jgi:nitrogen regulatory protein P-II 2
MKMVPLKLVTIIAEAVLEARLIREVRELGATGHTLSRVHGEGSRGVRASEWEGGNIRVETLVGDDLADRILQHIADNYFEHYAVVAFVTDAAVIRGDKYV